MRLDSQVERDRLWRAMEQSWRNLRPFREKFRQLVAEYAGSEYGQLKDSRRQKYANLMSQTIEAYSLSLAPSRPRVMVETHYQQLKPFAARFQVGLNNLAEEIQIEEVFRGCVIDALMGIGICKVYRADSPQLIQMGDQWVDPGRPYVDRISLDNWIHDTHATAWKRVRYAGDLYRVPFSSLSDDPRYDQDVVDRIQPSSKYQWSGEDERLAMISRGMETDQDDLEPMVDLLDLWYPEENAVYTFAVDSGRRWQGIGDGYLSVTEWNGPEFGPYKLLTFLEIPEQIMPASPAENLLALERLTNNLLRKQARKASGQREVYVYESGAEADADRIRRAGDQEWVHVAEKDKIDVVKMAGADPGTSVFLQGTIDLYDRMAGNLRVLAGLGPQSETARQEEIVSGQASKREALMASRTMTFYQRVFRDLGHLMWGDQALVVPGRVAIEGTSFSADSSWTPEQREGNFIQYNFTIDVYSLAYQTPMQKANALNQLLMQVYLPLVPALMQQGGQLNVQALVEFHSEMMGMPRLKDIITFPGQQVPAAVEPGETPGKAPTSRREYIRRNVPTGGTPESRTSGMMQQALGEAMREGRMTGAQGAGLMRPAGG